jgi:APA family basic amino acid/polyamine antiporter
VEKGFDAVSTAAQECKNPQRDLPLATMLSLGICTVLYIIVSLLVTGLVPYNEVRLTQARPLPSGRDGMTS